MLTAHSYNRILRFVALLSFLIGIGGFIVDLFVRLDYGVVIFAVNGAFMNALIWFVVWIGLGALFMVIAYAAEHLDAIYPDPSEPEDDLPSD